MSSGTYLGKAVGGKQDDMMSEGSYMVRQDKSFIDDAKSGVTAMGKIDEVSQGSYMVKMKDDESEFRRDMGDSEIIQGDLGHTIDDSLMNDNMSDGGSEMVRGDSQATL